MDIRRLPSRSILFQNIARPIDASSGQTSNHDRISWTPSEIAEDRSNLKLLDVTSVEAWLQLPLFCLPVRHATRVNICCDKLRLLVMRSLSSAILLLGKLALMAQVTLAQNLNLARYHNQLQDHFDQSNNRTWPQAYYVNATFWKPGSQSPIFLCVGGEGPALDSSVVVHSVHCNLALKSPGSYVRNYWNTQEIGS